MDDNFGVMSLGTIDSESWPTRLSRTRISSVQGLSLGRSPDTIAKTLEDVLRTVQRLGLKRYLYDSIESQGRIGEGESFCVDRCLHNEKVVAVKHIKLESLETDGQAFNRRLRTVLNEIRIMHHLPLQDHPNILSVLGYGWRTVGQSSLPYIVVEYGVYGSLRKYLSESPRSLHTKIIMAGDVAAGITALHQCDIIHGDLKLDNIVVMQSWDRPPGVIAKICDFGHSIILAGDKQHLKYYGTSMYNAPEVENQDRYPLSAEDLVKCDIWAFALALWETLDSGATFFKKSWRDHPSYAKSWPISLISAQQENSNSKRVVIEESIEEAIDDNQPVFGTFDFKYLCALGRDFINSLNFGSAFVDKACLRMFIHRALQVDPLSRPSKIQLGPVMSKWNPSDINTLHAKLAIHTGTSEWTFDLLKPDQDKEILWAHQKQILLDFEKLADPLKPTTESSAAAFQVAMCYMVGFGTCKSWSSAANFLQLSEELGHPAAKLFGSQLQSVIVSDHLNSPLDYTSQVVQGFEVQRPTEPITLAFQPLDDEAPPKYETSQEESKALYSGSNIKPNSLKPSTKYAPSFILFQTYQELKQWLHASPKDRANDVQLETAIITSNSLKMSILECAILFRDNETVEILLEKHPNLLHRRFLRDSLLVTACRTTNFRLVKTLLQSGLDPFAAEDGQDTLFHWLFMLGENLHILLPILLSTVGTRHHLLDARFIGTKVINPQWPLKLTGTPLAFAIVANSKLAVNTLLRLGSNPASSIYGSSESDEGDADWTPVHLAIKYHSVPLLSLLVANLKARRSGSIYLGSQQTLVIHENDLKTETEAAFQHLNSTSKSPDTWQSAIGCMLSFSSSVERIAFHGDTHQARLAKLIESLPSSCLVEPSKLGSVALMQAIDFFDVSVVKALLAAHPKLVNTPFCDPLDNHFVYPIHFASQIASHRDADDSLDILKILVALDPKQLMLRESRGRTPLHFAVTGSSDRVTKWLIENGGSVNATTNLNGTYQTPLHVIRMTSTMDILLNAGAKINQQDKFGRTLGHIAALTGQEHLVKGFIDRKARLDIKDYSGQTMLHCAVVRGSPGIVKVLLKAGLNVNAKTQDEDTPLHLAVQLFRSDVLRLLIEHGANLSARNRVDFTPLHQCVYAGDEICLRPLLDIIKSSNPSLIDARDKRQRTALHVAAGLARRSIVSELLSYGASPGLTDEHGNTPLHVVVDSSEEVIKRSQGDKVDCCVLLCTNLSTGDSAPELLMRNKFGSTPWDLAYESNQLTIIEVIIQYGGLKACAGFFYRKMYVGSLLIDMAIQREAWDLVILLLSDEETVLKHPTISYGVVKKLQMVTKVSDHTSARLILQSSFGGTRFSEAINNLDKHGNSRFWSFRDRIALPNLLTTYRPDLPTIDSANHRLVRPEVLVARDMKILMKSPELPYKIGTKLAFSIESWDDEETMRLVRNLPISLQSDYEYLGCYANNRSEYRRLFGISPLRTYLNSVKEEEDFLLIK